MDLPYIGDAQVVGADRGLAVKDNICVQGFATRAGSLATPDVAADGSAACVALAVEAGYRVVGKTHMDEFGMGGTGISEAFGDLQNPHDRSRISGGSSGGTAVAVAEGRVAAGLGTDTGGSIRIPAAFCGVVGFRPRQKIISTAGVMGLAPTLDSVGIIASSVGRMERILNLLAPGYNSKGEQVLSSPSVVVPTDWLPALDPEVSEAFNELVSLLNETLCIHQRAYSGLNKLNQAGNIISGYESARLYSRFLGNKDVGTIAESRIKFGLAIDLKCYRWALSIAYAQRRQFNSWISGVDAILFPTVGIVPPGRRELCDSTVSRINMFTRPLSMLDLSCLTIPIGRPGGLPVGVQIAARNECDAIAIGRLVESVAPKGN